jgi:transcriptional regulator with XRE-family HTH domain
VEKTLRSAGHLKFRKLLRDIRKERGLTQVQLAERIERDQSFVSRYEAGDKVLDIVELREICHALEISLESFVRRWEKLLVMDSKK